MKKRHAKEQERLYEEVLSAALRLAAEQGWSAVSIRNIASEIEYSTTKVYELFANKDQLILELLRRGFALLARQLREAVAKEAEPLDRAVALAKAYCCFAWDHGAYYRIMYGMDGVPFGVAETWQEGMEIGLISQEVVHVLVPEASEEQLQNYVYACWGTLHGISSLYMAKRLYGEREDAERLAVQAVLSIVGLSR